MSLRNWLRTRPANTGRTSRPRLGVHQLEGRSVPAALASAFGFGNGDGSTQVRDVAVDAAGNTYTAGHFSGSVDFDPARTRPDGADLLTSRGGTDAFVARYAPDGSLAWARRMGGADVGGDFDVIDTADKLAVDGSGNVYVAGRFAGSADFGATALASAGGRDAFAAKLDAAGAIKWAARWGTAADDNGCGVGADAAGNVYALSYRRGDAYDVVKFGPTGAAAWSKAVATRSSMSSADLAVDASGNAYVGGSFTGFVDFDPGPKTRYVSSGPEHSGFVLKLSAAGAFSWVSPFVGQAVGSTAGFSAVQSIALDGSGSVVVGGSYDGPVDFNPGSGTTSLPAIGGGFVAKLAAAGGLTWARALESASTTFVYGLTVDAAGGIYAAGNMFGTTDFDPGAGVTSRATAGGADAFVVKLDAAGTFKWAETFGSAGSDIGWGVAVDGSGAVSLAGSYEGAVDFDPDPAATYELANPGPYRNGFLVRLRQS